jgi:hypothetical protein
MCSTSAVYIHHDRASPLQVPPHQHNTWPLVVDRHRQPLPLVSSAMRIMPLCQQYFLAYALYLGETTQDSNSSVIAKPT